MADNCVTQNPTNTMQIYIVSAINSSQVRYLLIRAQIMPYPTMIANNIYQKLSVGFHFHLQIICYYICISDKNKPVKCIPQYALILMLLSRELGYSF